MRFIISATGAPLWTQARDLTGQVYAASFGASVHGSTDAFVVALDDKAPTVRACVGVNYGLDRPFFLEHYLPTSAEEVATIHLGQVCRRASIVELGPLVSVGNGAGRALIKTLPIFAHERGLRCGLLTATRGLAVVMRYLRLPFEPLGRARLQQLPVPARDGWGTYYDHAPMTGLIRLDRVQAAMSTTAHRTRTTSIRDSFFDYEDVTGRSAA